MGRGGEARRRTKCVGEPTRSKIETTQQACLLTIDNIVEVHIGITKGAAGDGVAADADGGYRADRVEHLEQHGLVHGRIQLSDVERGGGGRCGGGHGSKVGSLGSLGLGSGNLLLLFDAQVVRLGWSRDSGLDVRRSNGGRHYGCFLAFFFGGVI